MSTPIQEPINPEHEKFMKGIGDALDQLLNPSGEKKIGFTLFCYKFGDAEGQMDYVANTKVEDIVELMRSFVEKEGNV